MTQKLYRWVCNAEIRWRRWVNITFSLWKVLCTAQLFTGTDDCLSRKNSHYSLSYINNFTFPQNFDKTYNPLTSISTLCNSRKLSLLVMVLSNSVTQSVYRWLWWHCQWDCKLSSISGNFPVISGNISQSLKVIMSIIFIWIHWYSWTLCYKQVIFTKRNAWSEA